MVGRPNCDRIPRPLIENSVWGPHEVTGVDDEYIPTTWDGRAYVKIFEKFRAKDRKEDVPSDVCDIAIQRLVKEMEPMKNCRRVPYEMTTANAKSNPGYPWRLCYPTEEDVRLDHGYMPVYDMARDRSRPLWYSFLKKEMLKRSKVEDNDIRMILCPPWPFKRIQASFDEDQNSKMKEHTLTNECQVGWCPVKRGLDIRLRMLSHNRDTFVTVDYTRYDGTIPVDVLLMVREMRADHMEIDDDERDLLNWVNWNLLDKVVVLANGKVVKVTGGNPSGQVSTSIDNCLVNTYITACCNVMWYKQCVGEVPTVERLLEWHDQLVYGDDRIGAYNTSICPVPDPKWVIDFFANYFGMWVKPQNIVISKKLSKMEFCGMKFHLDPRSDAWVGVYKSEKIKAAIVNPVKPAESVEVLKAKLGSAKVLCAYDPATVAWIDDKVRAMDMVCSTDFQVPTLQEAKLLWTDQNELKDFSKLVNV
uniref:Non-structural polyprotein 1AB n=1 Tax=Wenling perciformes astrovirus 2 TaxID=2116153 RepID=A0A2P1GNU2_9VIRU|nr:ORF1b [Wenling perciformes astrovirus 2]